MINQESLNAVKAASFGSEFCKPLYPSYCFSQIPRTIEELFSKERAKGLPRETVGEESYDVVVLFLIDGFGWRFFEKYCDRYPFLQRALSEGRVSKLTSQFPSTTAPHVTCLNTGLSTGESGVYEWFYYEPKVDGIICPLLFSHARDKEAGTLAKVPITPQEIYPTQTIYQKLKKKGVNPYVMQHKHIAHSPYSQVMSQGATIIPYSGFSEGLHQVTSLCKEATSPTYIFSYFGDIDSAGHRHGIDSKAFDDAVDLCWKSLESLFWDVLRPTEKNIAVLFVADHGMVEVNPKTTIYINQQCPEILPWIKRNRKGELLSPAGSCRDLFLHINDAHLDDAYLFLKKQFQNKAEIYKTEELLKRGFFGKEAPSQLLLDRVGNLVVLPYEQEAIWWYEKNYFEQHFYAAHGGLTRHEMEIPFLFLEV